MFDWYKIFNLTEFNATGLVSRTYGLLLEELGYTEFLVTKGNMVGITYDDTYTPVNFGDNNPYQLGSYAVYTDDNDDVYVGFPVA